MGVVINSLQGKYKQKLVQTKVGSVLLDLRLPSKLLIGFVDREKLSGKHSLKNNLFSRAVLLFDVWLQNIYY